MDREKIKELNELLEKYKALKENNTVREVSFLTDEHVYGVESNPAFIKPLLDTMIMTIEKQLETARYGTASEELQSGREYKAAMALENALNSFSFNPDRFAKAIPYMHRTLQQNLFRLIRSCICFMAEADSSRIDGRNEASQEMCRAIVDTVKESPLPYI